MAIHAKPLIVSALSLAVSAVLIAGETWAKGPKRSSSSSKPSSSAKPVEKEKAPRTTEIHINVPRGSGSAPAPGGTARSMTGAAGAAAAGAAGAAIAPGGKQESPEEARQRIDQRDAQMKAEQEEKARRRSEDERLAALAARDRELKAAEAEKARLARQQRNQQALGGASGGCVIKPVMTDDEIAACRR